MIPLNAFISEMFLVLGVLFWWLFWIGIFRNPKQSLIALDQWLACIFLPDSHADETISAWSHRKQHCRLEWCINFLFRNPNHCAEAYRSELDGSQNAQAYRS